MPVALPGRRGVGGDGDAAQAVAIDIGKEREEQVAHRIAGIAGAGDVFGHGGQRGIAAECRRVVGGGDVDGDRLGAAGGAVGERPVK